MRPYGSILKRESIAFSLARVADDIFGWIPIEGMGGILVEVGVQLSFQREFGAQVTDEILIL